MRDVSQVQGAMPLLQRHQENQQAHRGHSSLLEDTLEEKLCKNVFR